MTALQSKYSGWLIHLTAWAVIFGMPLFVTSPDRPLMTGSEYLRFLLVPLSFMVVFYTNYFLLIERYLFTRQTGRFLGGNALLIAAVIVGLGGAANFQYNVRDLIAEINQQNKKD